MLFLCSLNIIASATDYYISSSGNDAANGLSSSTPWQSINKVNSISSGLRGGDRLLFRRGDTFKGSLELGSSGASGSPITIGAYGTGENPVISGFTQVSGWTSYGNGIYYRSLSCESNPNIVLVNGKNTPIGKWPNSGFIPIDSHVSNTSVTGSELPSYPTWTGGEVVIRKSQHVWDRNRITNHSGTTIYYQSGSDYHAEDGYGFFIQNHISTLDQVGEWYYDGEDFYMYFGSNNPENYNVKVSSIDQLLFLDANSNITIDNLAFEGANVYAVQVKNSANVTIQNCRISFIGKTGIFGPWWGDAPYCRIANNVIDNCNNNGIQLAGDHPNATVTGNTLTNNGLIIGMGDSGDGTYMAINVVADNVSIISNTIRNTGYIGVYFGGNNASVSNNVISDFDLVKNDGGAIYTWNGTGAAVSGLKITGNIIMNGVGFGEATPDKSVLALGIYMDERSRNVTISKNTIFNCSASGIFLHNAHEINITENTVYNNGSGRKDHGSQILFVHDGYSPDDPIRNINMTNNIFFARTDEQALLAFCTADNDIPSFGSADYNYFARPLDNSSMARTWSQGWYSQQYNRSLSNWQSFTDQDWNSKPSPISLSDVNKIRFEYNASNSNKVVSLDGSYIDVKGAKYSGSLTLAPYSSVVLMVDPNPSAPPATPAFVSASVENSAPSVIEMNYNLSLANIIPATSAFSVQVNSAARNVTSVTISGTRVRLTLASPVASGNTVKVSYTAPSSNPIQTPAGGKAASISGQNVTNNVTPPPVPAFTGATVENAAPSVVVLNFSLSLAGITPAASAFAVNVNSAARAVSSVFVSGTQVKLTLASPVANGNTVTVAYTKPSTSPLQTTAGGQAATFSAQPVTNNVSATVTPPSVVTPPAATNTPPVVTINYVKAINSGFVGTLNASGSYDANKDNLTYTWKAPANIPVSSVNGPVIQYLAPVVDSKQTFDFTLVVSDGKSPQTKVIPVEIVPYQPQLESAEIIAIETDESQSSSQPYNIVDGNIGTTWAVQGRDQWIILELKTAFSIQHVKLAFQPNQKREFYFDVYGSNDKETWEPILSKTSSCAFSGNLQVFDFPASKAEREFKYVKVVGQGNSTDQWNYIAEFRIFGFRYRNPSYEEQIVKIYPNPATEIVNVKIDEPSFVPDFINILTLTGKIIYTNIIEPDKRLLQIPVNFKKGIYLIQMGKGSITMFSQKLVVAN